MPICRVWQLGTRGRLRLMEGDWASGRRCRRRARRPERPAGPHVAPPRPGAGRPAARRRRRHRPRRRLGAGERLGEPIRVLPAAAALAERTWLTGEADEHVAGAWGLLREHTEPGLEWRRATSPCGCSASTRPPRCPAASTARSTASSSTVPAEAAHRWEKLGAPFERALALVETGGRRPPARASTCSTASAPTPSPPACQDLRERGVARSPPAGGRARWATRRA